MAQEITPDAIMQLGFGYWGSKTLLSAVELGLFTELAKGSLTLDQIQARLNLHGEVLAISSTRWSVLGCFNASRASTPIRLLPIFTLIGRNQRTWAACWR